MEKKKKLLENRKRTKIKLEMSVSSDNTVVCSTSCLTCADVELHGLLLLPPLDASVLLLQGADVRVHPLHHHAVDGCLMLCPGSTSSCSPTSSASSCTSCSRSAHGSGAQRRHVALFGSLVCGSREEEKADGHMTRPVVS